MAVKKLQLMIKFCKRTVNYQMTLGFACQNVLHLDDVNTAFQTQVCTCESVAKSWYASCGIQYGLLLI